MSRRSPGDVSPLRRRLGALFIIRLVLAAAVLVTVAVFPAAIASPGQSVTVLVASYLVVTLGIELVRQWRTSLPPVVVGSTILVDGIFIAAALTLSGGPSSGLSFLLYVHLVAVTLLASYRTGLQIAVWQSLLLIATHYVPESVTGVPPLSVTDATSSVLAFLGVAVATAVCSALNERELRRSRTGFKSLAELAAQLEDAADPDHVVTLLARSIGPAFGVPRVAVLLRTAGSLVVCAGDRLQHSSVTTDNAVSGVIADCWQARGPVLRKSLDPVADAALAAALPAARNLIVLPFTADGVPTGVVVVEHGGHGRRTINAATVNLMSQFTIHAALAHRNIRLLAEVHHLATVDALTGLANRGTFEAALQREVARALRSGEDLSLLLVDVDHFKQVNDTHGHPMGDEVLRHVGRVLAGSGREFDLPARYGGEEFAVILPGCAGEEAVRVAERLRTAIADDTAPLPITASVGVAAVHRNAMDAEGLVRAADAALYAAKSGGRNRTAQADNRLRAVVA